MRYETSYSSIFFRQSISRAVKTAMEKNRRISVYRSYVPNRFLVRVPKVLFEKRNAQWNSIQRVVREAVYQFLDREAFSIVGPIELSMVEAEVPKGRMTIDAEFAHSTQEKSLSVPDVVSLTPILSVAVALLAALGAAAIAFEGVLTAREAADGVERSGVLLPVACWIIGIFLFGASLASLLFPKRGWIIRMSGERLKVRGYVLVGSGALCDIRGSSLLKKHARFFVRGPSLYIENLSSKGDVIVNRTTIKEITAINPGDRVRIGDIVMRVEA